MINKDEYICMPEKSFYIIPEVAKIIFKSEVTVRRYVKSGFIKGFYKMGKEWRIEKEDLEKFINQTKKVSYEK
jgi:excisionase family DNA binding protein